MLYYWYSIFYIYTHMLTEQQKNYLDMLLVGDSLTPEEIRLFLGRSGWTPEQIEAGILASKKVTPPSNSAVPPSSIDSRIENDIAFISPHTVADSYKEPFGASGNELGNISQDVQTMSVSTVPVLGNSTNALSISTPSRMMGGDMRGGMGAQSTIVNNGTNSAYPILKFIAWILFAILLCMSIGLVGYMYYSHTGVFANIVYTRIF